MIIEYKKPTQIGLITGSIIVILGKALSAVEPELGGIISLVGGIPFIWGCASFMKGKGHSGWWGALGIFFILGLLILLFFPDKHKSGSIN